VNPGNTGTAPEGEAVVFASEEEAAAIVAANAGAGAVVEAGAFGGSTFTAGSFLAMIWKAVENGGKLSNSYQVPKESIQRITQTKSSTSSSACPIQTGLVSYLPIALLSFY